MNSINNIYRGYFSTFPLLLILFTPLSAQDVTVFGHVYSVTTSSGIMMPVEGAEVGIGMNSVPEGTITHTDAEGFYELSFEWSWDGPIPIICQAEGYEFYVYTFMPDANSSEYEFDIYLTPIGGDVMTSLEGGVWENTGCMGGPVGCPIVGANISAVPLNSPNDVAFNAVSDEWGHYAIELPVGAYVVTCSADGWITETAILEIGPNGASYDFNLFDENNPQTAKVSGMVSGQMSPMGPVFPIAGAHISIASAWSGQDAVETTSNEEGYYELELENPSPNMAYVVTCTAEEFDSQFATIYFAYQNDVELNFHFNAWEEPEVPAPYDLMVEFELLPSGEAAILNWHYDSVNNNLPLFLIYASNSNSNEWSLIGESDENHFEYFAGGPMGVPDCYYITAILYDVESEPSNIACGESNPDPECEDLSPYDFGDCEMVIGIGWNGEECTWFSGCGTVDQYGVDHAGSFFETMEGCHAACEDVNENGTLAGEVFYQWGDAIELVAGAVIQVMSANGNMIYTTETNEEGHYQLELPAGYYVVTCTVYTGDSQTHDVEINHGASYILDFWFGEPYYETVLTGMVYDANHEGQLVNEGVIMAHGNDGVIIETFINQGWYWLSLPSAGTYYIGVEADGYFPMDVTLDITGVTSFDFYLTPMDDYMDPQAILSLEDVEAIPGDESQVTVPLYLHSEVAVAGLQFAVWPSQYSFEYYLMPADLESMNECFTAEWNDVYGQLWGIMFSLDGCVFEPGIDHHVANLTFAGEGYFPAGIEIPLVFNYTLVADHEGNEVPSEGEGCIVTFGLPGDVNFDGEVNILDIIQTVNFILQIDEPTEVEFSAGDVNGDSALNIMDIVLMVNMILGD